MVEDGVVPIEITVLAWGLNRATRRGAGPVRLEFVVRPPLGAGPSPGSGRPNGHCSVRHGPPCGRFPVTLYKEQWITLLAMTDEIRAFLTEHDAELKTKSEA